MQINVNKTQILYYFSNKHNLHNNLLLYTKQKSDLSSRKSNLYFFSHLNPAINSQTRYRFIIDSTEIRGNQQTKPMERFWIITIELQTTIHFCCLAEKLEDKLAGNLKATIAIV